MGAKGVCPAVAVRHLHALSYPQVVATVLPRLGITCWLGEPTVWLGVPANTVAILTLLVGGFDWGAVNCIVPKLLITGGVDPATVEFIDVGALLGVIE